MIAAEIIPVEFEHFRKRAHQLTGMALTSYKAPQMHRRLSALLTRLRIDSFAEYARVLVRYRELKNAPPAGAGAPTPPPLDNATAPPSGG